MATKHNANTLETKYKAMLEVENGVKTKIAKDLDVLLNTIFTWFKKADDYKKAYETQSFGPLSEQEDVCRL